MAGRRTPVKSELRWSSEPLDVRSHPCAWETRFLKYGLAALVHKDKGNTQRRHVRITLFNNGFKLEWTIPAWCLHLRKCLFYSILGVWAGNIPITSSRSVVLVLAV
eukprot:1837561-Amphidinium_carterae.1